METFDPRGAARFDWQDLCIGPLDIANTNYISYSPNSFREEEFNSLSHYKSM